MTLAYRIDDVLNGRGTNRYEMCTAWHSVYYTSKQYIRSDSAATLENGTHIVRKARYIAQIGTYTASYCEPLSRALRR